MGVSISLISLLAASFGLEYRWVDILFGHGIHFYKGILMD